MAIAMAIANRQQRSVTNSSPANDSATNSSYAAKLAGFGRQASSAGASNWRQAPSSSSASSTASSASTATLQPADRRRRRCQQRSPELGQDSIRRELARDQPFGDHKNRARNPNGSPPSAGNMSSWGWEPATIGHQGQNYNGQNQNQHQYYYYNNSNQQHQHQPQSSLATDEMASDSSHSYQQRPPVDYHYYQVVVPPERPGCIGQKPQSPCRSIQRLVSTLFSPTSNQSHGLDQHQGAMVSQEPLIRSSSWQNKTLINLGHSTGQRPSLAPAMELNQLEQQQQQDHYYCALPPPQNYHQQLYASQQLHLKTLPCQEKSPAADLLSGAPAALAGLGFRPDQPPPPPPGATKSSKRPPGATRQCLLLALLLLAAAMLLLFLLLASIGRQQQHHHQHQQHHQSNKLQPPPPPPMEANNKAAGARHEPPPPPPPPPISVNESPGPQTSGLPPPAGQHQHQSSTPMPVIPNAIELLWSEGAASKWSRQLDQEQSQCRMEHQFCGPKGRCDTDGLCYCQPGHSGPNCGQNDCPDGCSQQGSCQLRPESSINRLMATRLDTKTAALSSIGFASLSASPQRNSLCSDDHDNATLTRQLSTSGFSNDPRLEWRCECGRGFTGADCSRQQELQCSNGHDDDGDGLIDCDDDDCCQQPQCSANVMCFQSPEPQLMLDTLVGAHSPLHQELQLPNQLPNASVMLAKEQLAGFYTQMRFLIGVNSTQSYAHESSLDKSRLAVIRGRVVKPSADGSATNEGIMSVRVSVVNKVEYGFTLTRQDGYFDLLVNGSEWITLYFLRSGSPAKRKLFVRPQTINLLQQDIEMWLSSSGTGLSGQSAGDQVSLNQGQPKQDSFNLQLQWELNRWLSVLRRPNHQAQAQDSLDERRQLECVRSSVRQFGGAGDSWNQAEPRLATFAASRNTEHLMNTFVTANEGAYEAKIALHLHQQPPPPNTANHSLLYNSAAFTPASSLVKPLLSIKLLDSSKPLPERLSLIHLQLDIEGQSKREQLEPKRGLTYQFAWNRRNVYHQKVYGFGQLNLRLGYQYELSQANQTALNLALQECLSLNLGPNELAAASDKLKQAASSLVAALDKRVVWFERRIHLEAHQMNQQADLGKWAMDSLNRYDPERQLLYLGIGRSLPFKLAYPPVVLTALDGGAPKMEPTTSAVESARRRHLSRGANSMFVVVRGERLQQLDSSGRRRLIDLPLASLTSAGFNQNHGDDAEILYNNLAGMLYISSRQAGKILQVSYASLLVLNKTLVGHSPTAAPDDEIDIEPLAGFGQLQPSQLAKPAKQMHLEGPHSMTLDEERQLLYFVDGPSRLVALDLLTRRLALLPMGQPDFDARQSPPLCHLGSRLPITEFRPHKMEALTWARSESALLLLDRNMLYALRQDLWLELLAIGTPSPCPVENNPSNLGYIRELTMDADDLIIAHQWTIEAAAAVTNGQKKTIGRFYLAKMSLGVSGSRHQAIFDLHSSQQTWDPMIWSLAAAAPSATNLHQPPIDWQRLARRPIQVAPGEQSGAPRQSMQQLASSSSSTIPFIHLLQGFRRLDSLETNTDGSIFALTDGGHSIKMIVAYSPNEFNSIERHDVNINRLFAANQPSAESLHQIQHQQQQQLDQDIVESTKLNVIFLEEPITRQLLEFHGSSGLQLSSKSPTGTELKSNFYYRILTNNKMIELDEDDKYDFQVQKLILNYMWHTGNLKQNLVQLTGAYVRLNRILDSNRNEYELQRLYTGSRFVLQSIQFNRQPLCEVATDYQGLLTTYQPSTKDVWLELVYDGQTYLLRDIVSKSEGSFSSLQPLSQLNTNHNNKLKRIVYDRVFYHYCDLFIVDAA